MRSGTTPARAEALIVNQGGQFQVGGTNFVVGNNAGSFGSLVINAGGTFKFTGTATASTVLNIGRSAATDAQPGAAGTALVTGTGALLSTNGSALEVGRSGLGSLTVSKGGSVAAGTPDSGALYGLGIAYSGGTGSITVTDPGSTFTLTGFGFDGRGGSGVLTIQNFGSFVVNDAPTNNGGFSIGVGRGAGPTASTNIGGAGTATVRSNGVLRINSIKSGIGVGGNGADGVLNVSNGGTVLAGNGMSVGTATSAGGTIYGGTGELNIGAGGVVRVNSPPTGYGIYVGTANSSIGGALTGTATGAASGEAVVSGAGALLDANGSGIAIGWLSTGSMTISQGATAVAGSSDDAQFSPLSVGRRASGSLVITDPGSTFKVGGLAYLGRAGSGNLLIENHGSLIGLVDKKGDGGINVGGTGIGTIDGVTNIVTGGNGSALVTSGGLMSSQRSIQVGTNGTDGQLTVNNGGTVVAGTQVIIGDSVVVPAGVTIITPSDNAPANADTLIGTSGVVNVGAGGLLKAAGTGLAAGTPTLVIGNGAGGTGYLNVAGVGAQVISVGQMDVGQFGAGQLQVQNHATVVTGNSTIDKSAGFDIGAGAGSSGTATVFGSGSLLSNKGRFVVGDAGMGSLAIQSGGTVITTPGTVAGLAGAEIAAHAGSSGSSVNVSGAGSSWKVTGALVVGEAAAGSLAIIAGGTVTAASLDAGKNIAAAANISVFGTASALTLSGLLTVGDAAHADMTIASGGSVTAANVDIGVQATGSGTVNLTGSGSHLNVANALNVGKAGTANLSLAALTEVTANQINIGVGGTITSSGWVIDPLSITNHGKIIGNGKFVGSVVNSGNVNATNGAEEITGAVTGTGILEVGNKGNLKLDGLVGVGQTVQFDDSAGILTIGSIGAFAATISKMLANDQDHRARRVYRLNQLQCVNPFADAVR